MPDLTEPDLDVVQQEYPEPDAVQDIQRVVVPVRPVGPVTTQELSARTAIAGYVNTALTVASQLAPSDLRRKNIKILLTQTCYVGHNKQLVTQGEVGQLIAGVVLTLDTSEAVWIMPVTTAGVASYWISQWAD
jgi:hypothetical protein